MSELREKLEAKVREWRNLGEQESIHNHFGRAGAYEDCADELESLFSSTPEPAGVRLTVAKVALALEEFGDGRGNYTLSTAYRVNELRNKLNAFLSSAQPAPSEPASDDPRTDYEPRDETERDYGARMYQMGRRHMREETGTPRESPLTKGDWPGGNEPFPNAAELIASQPPATETVDLVNFEADASRFVDALWKALINWGTYNEFKAGATKFYAAWLPVHDAEVRLDEAKWWAAGYHAAKYEDSGCETTNCQKCKRISKLKQALRGKQGQQAEHPEERK